MGEEAERERYVLVVKLPREVEIRIEDTYLGLGGTTKPTLGYHITLLGPFCLDEGREVPHDEVRAVAEQVTAFTVRLEGLESFETPNDNLVFLDLADLTRMAAVHSALLQALQDYVNWSEPRFEEWMVRRYHPHVTLGLGLSDTELSEFLRFGASHLFQATFEVTRMCMARQVPHGPWEFVAEYPFYGQLPSNSPENRPCAQ